MTALFTTLGHVFKHSRLLIPHLTQISGSKKYSDDVLEEEEHMAFSVGFPLEGVDHAAAVFQALNLCRPARKLQRRDFSKQDRLFVERRNKSSCVAFFAPSASYTFRETRNET